MYTYTYDNADRVTKVTHKLNNGSTVTLANNTYDKLGRLQKNAHNGLANLTTNYTYNVRNWMTGMTGNLYAQALTYSYGGNIDTQQWTQDSKTRKYTYTYDGLNRLTAANYTGDGNYATSYAYDRNGNIKTLQRYDVSLVDNLTLNYNGNQLTKVEGASGNTFGFADGTSEATEYYYDANGNLTKDLNKNITNITYNSLYLPHVVTFGDGSTITYTYATDGRKLRTVHVIDGDTTTTDYCGSVVYENGAAKLLLIEGGYVDLTDNSYHFYIKDHLGNNRIVADANGNVEESNQYYPFGLSYADANSNLQPYKYNGKELDTKNALNWYDYGARHYDAALGRWFVVDPLAEKYHRTSPFAYCLDNPILQYDPDGCRVRPSNPVRRGYRNGGRFNPYAFYPGGIQPQSYRQINRVSYKGESGLYEKIALGEQNYVKNVTVGDNTVQMSRNNIRGINITGRIGLLNNAKDFSERLLDMSTETIYHADGRKSKSTNYVILDADLAAAQEEYSENYNRLSQELGDDMPLLEKNAIIQEEIGISPLMTIIMDMLMNPDKYEMDSQKQTISEFRQGR